MGNFISREFDRAGENINNEVDRFKQKINPDLPEEERLAIEANERIERLESERALERYNRDKERRPIKMEAFAQISGFKTENGKVVPDSRYRREDGTVIVDTNLTRDRYAQTDAAALDSLGSANPNQLEGAIDQTRELIGENAQLGTIDATSQQLDLDQGLNSVALIGQGQSAGNQGLAQQVAGQASNERLAERGRAFTRSQQRRSDVAGLAGLGLGALANSGGGQ